MNLLDKIRKHLNPPERGVTSAWWSDNKAQVTLGSDYIDAQDILLKFRFRGFNDLSIFPSSRADEGSGNPYWLAENLMCVPIATKGFKVGDRVRIDLHMPFTLEPSAVDIRVIGARYG